jgi:pimeloyl-ACP methyl ester carboxylesterase
MLSEKHRDQQIPACLRPQRCFRFCRRPFSLSKSGHGKGVVDLMAQLGIPNFTLIGHDGGGSVSYRMALDHPTNGERLAVFDVVPILEAWSRSGARIAKDLQAVDPALAKRTASGE